MVFHKKVTVNRCNAGRAKIWIKNENTADV